MVNVSIKSLICMAQDYVNSRGIDGDKSETINNNRELELLLAGTGASSIEDLTVENIRQKMIERDTEKIFTTFMATENKEQAKNNCDHLAYSMDKISDTYEKMLEGFDVMSHLMLQVGKQLEELDRVFNEGIFGQEAVDRVVNKLENFYMLTFTLLKELDKMNEEYRKITDQDFSPIVQKIKILMAAEEQLNEQIHTITNASVPIEQIKDEIAKGILKIQSALKEICALEEQYKGQKEKDIAFLSNLYDYQMQFLEEGKYSKEERQAYSKDLLAMLVEKTSPMTKNFVINQAEIAYEPENDPTTTGIEQNENDPTRIKRSTFKTQNEIYKLNGENVIVYDYSGRVLRTEALDPLVHTKFFE